MIEQLNTNIMKSKRISRTIWITLLCVAFAGTFTFLWIKSRPKTVTYQLLSLQDRDIVNSIIATGKLEPSNEVQIKPQISGIIESIHVKAGDAVRSGDVIATIKVVPEMSSLNSAEGRVRSASINHERIRKEYLRNKTLHAKGIISDEEFEKSSAEMSSSEEEVENAKDALKIITDGVSEKYSHLSNTQVRSTIDGTILEIPVEVGNSVIQANTFNDGTTIATVANLGNMIFKGDVDEADIGAIVENMDVKIKVGALKGCEIDGILSYVSPKANTQNNATTFAIEAIMSVPDSITLRAGYSATAEIITLHKKGVPSIDESALIFSADSTFVDVLTGTDGDRQLFKRQPVITGVSDGIYIEITSGITAQDKIKGNEIL